MAHSLVGWALGEAGLKRKTGLGVSTLIIAANLPDIDALGIPFGENLAFRRGITHGPLAMALMVPLLAAAMLAFDRWQTRRGSRPEGRLPLHFGWLLALGSIGMLSHPALDFLNVYGIRLLMPFSERWVYGDTLFIIDVWVWLALGIGIALARRRASEMPARSALVVVGVYIGLMAWGSHVAERRTGEAVLAAGYGNPRQVVANPPPFNPFARTMIYDLGGSYGYGSAKLVPLRIAVEPPFATNMTNPAIRIAAARDKRLADFLYWSRLPFAEVSQAAGGTRLVLRDARFVSGRMPDLFRIEAFVMDAPK